MHVKMVRTLFKKSKELLKDPKTVQVVQMFAKLFTCSESCSSVQKVVCGCLNMFECAHRASSSVLLTLLMSERMV